jgi:phospholipid/cholesterol/gamma-HCH transport system substrate-binding protein
MRDLKLVNREVAKEHVALRRLVTSLANVNERLGDDPRDLTELVDTSAATFRAFASEDDNLRETVSELAPTLTQAHKTLRVVRPFAEELGPATESLIPAMRALNRANPQVERLGKTATPIVRDQIRPFTRAARPVVRDLRPTAKGLAKTFPELTRDFKVLNHFFNLLAFNPNGREPADKPGREEGYLWWLAWVSHQGTNLQNIDDANGPMRPVFLTGTCTTLQNFIASEGVDAPLLEFGLNLSPLFANLCGDPDTGPSVDLDALLDVLPPRLTRELPKPILQKVDSKASEKIDRALAKARARGADK